jgi:hypothetical protein
MSRDCPSGVEITACAPGIWSILALQAIRKPRHRTKRFRTVSARLPNGRAGGASSDSWQVHVVAGQMCGRELVCDVRETRPGRRETMVMQRAVGTRDHRYVSCPTSVPATSRTPPSARARTRRASATATSWVWTCRGTRPRRLRHGS